MEDFSSYESSLEIHETLYGLHRNQSFTAVLCYPVAQITSRGFWHGNEHNNYYTLPLLLLQSAVMLILSRLLHLLFKPLNLPSVFSDILAGVILGPSVLGQFQWIYRALFPRYSIFSLRTISWLGVIYYLFLIGVKMDASMIMRGGRAAGIALSGILLGMAGATLVILPLQSYTFNTMAGGGFLVVFVVTQALAASTVVYHLLAEFRLLNSELGRLSLSVAMLNEALCWKAGIVDLRKKLEQGLVPDAELKKLIRIQLGKRLQWGYKPTYEEQLAQVLELANSAVLGNVHLDGSYIKSRQE
ncbi:hypothetical protein ACLOJK_031421 [Asimina triloba]